MDKISHRFTGFQSTSRSGIKPYFVLWAWFGLFAGLVEGVARLVLREFSARVVAVPTEILWIAPTFDLILFVLIGASVYILTFWVNEKIRLQLTLSLFCWIIFFGVFIVIGQISQVAGLLLSLGLAVEIGRRLFSRASNLLAFTKRSLPFLFAFAVVIGIVAGLSPIVVERLALKQISRGYRSGPNVIFVTLDTVRADHLSSYGYDRSTTPNIDHIGAQGAIFENAFSNSSWTLPSHASLFTGLLPQVHGADWKNPLDDRFVTLAEVLQSNGYNTAAFAANTEYVTPEWGLNQGFIHFEAYGNSLVADAVQTIYGKKLALNILPRLGYYDIPGRKNAAEVNREFFRWLERRDQGPFFAFLNYFDAHDPYITNKEYQYMYSSGGEVGSLINFQFQVPFRRKAKLDAQEIQSEINGYDASLAYLDSQIGSLIDHLKQLGLDQNTLVIITSDHGEAFGNHNLFGHGNSLYLETLHVPLIFYWPDHIDGGKRITEVVGLNDIPVTVLDLLDLIKAQVEIPGNTLAGLLGAPGFPSNTRNQEVIAELSSGRFDKVEYPYPNAKNDLQSILTDQWHMIKTDQGKVELYAWKADRQENNDISQTSSAGEIIRQLNTEIDSQTLINKKVLSRAP